jgi:hypothetical protein
MRTREVHLEVNLFCKLCETYAAIQIIERETRLPPDLAVWTRSVCIRSIEISSDINWKATRREGTKKQPDAAHAGPPLSRFRLALGLLGRRGRWFPFRSFQSLDSPQCSPSPGSWFLRAPDTGRRSSRAPIVRTSRLPRCALRRRTKTESSALVSISDANIARRPQPKKEPNRMWARLSSLQTFTFHSICFGGQPCRSLSASSRGRSKASPTALLSAPRPTRVRQPSTRQGSSFRCLRRVSFHRPRSMRRSVPRASSRCPLSSQNFYLQDNKSAWVDLGAGNAKPDIRERLDKARISPAQATRLVKVCGSAIRERGLQTLGVFRPFRLAESRENIFRLVAIFLGLDADRRDDDWLLGEKKSSFEEEIESASIHDVVAVLKWVRSLKQRGP